MTKRAIVGVVVMAAVVMGCRTNIAPVKKTAEEEVYVPQGGCNVRRYPEATDLPEGSKDLGWLTIDRAESDEATYELLDKAICEKGGDALSSLHWEKDSTETTAQKVSLRARAWVLP